MKLMEFLYKDLSYKLRGIFFDIHNTLGSGFKEIIYQKAVIKEFKNANIPFIAEAKISVKYKGEKIGDFKPDFIIDDKIIVEIKAVEFVPQNYEIQLLHYLKCTSFKLGFLVNFGSGKLYIKRIIWSQ